MIVLTGRTDINKNETVKQPQLLKKWSVADTISYAAGFLPFSTDCLRVGQMVNMWLRVERLKSQEDWKQLLRWSLSSWPPFLDANKSIIWQHKHIFVLSTSHQNNMVCSVKLTVSWFCAWQKFSFFHECKKAHVTTVSCTIISWSFNITEWRCDSKHTFYTFLILS
jgi:hypothetical protein